METDANEMNIDNDDLSPSEWLKEFIIISKEMESEMAANKEFSESIETDSDDDDEDDDDDDDDDDDEDDDEEDNDDKDNDDSDDDYDDDYDNIKEGDRKKLYLRMNRMARLFLSQPRLIKICEDWKNKFIPTCLKKYKLIRDENSSVFEIHEKANDLKYVINLCGTNFKRLNVKNYPISQIMPIINANCPNLESLTCAFEEIIEKDFENCFSNMSKLKRLTIYWQCENSTLPMTLAKSLEQIGGTLKDLNLICSLEENNIFLPDSLAPVFPRLTALADLDMCGFVLSQLLLQSISQMINLTRLSLMSSWPKNHPMSDTIINLCSIGNLKNLETLIIHCDYSVTDEFLINLCNNAKKILNLRITGTNITDTGMRAINNLEQLHYFNLDLGYRQQNQFITDESIQCLFNQKLDSLKISNCINVTDKSVLKLFENLPNLTDLSIENTKVTREAVEKIYELGKQRRKRIFVSI